MTRASALLTLPAPLRFSTLSVCVCSRRRLPGRGGDQHLVRQAGQLVAVDDRPQNPALDVVVKSFTRRPTRGVTEDLLELSSVDDPPEVEQPHLIFGEVDDPGAAQYLADRRHRHPRHRPPPESGPA